MTDPVDEFTYRRVHQCPRELVFSCMTTPAHLARFWGPDGTHTPEDRIVVDLRPGGAFETTMINDTFGSEHTMRAVYVEVDPPSTLVWREVDTGMLTTVTFGDLGDGTTEVVTRQTGVPPQYRAPEARAGWLTSLDRAADYLRRVASGEPGSHATGSDLGRALGPATVPATPPANTPPETGRTPS
jgi:uncharacterized protein YndB with AHSA1/START domain